MKKINYRKIAAYSLLLILTIAFLYLVAYKLYILPIFKFAYSFESGLLIFALLTVFYIGLIKIIDWLIKGISWLFENM